MNNFLRVVEMLRRLEYTCDVPDTSTSHFQFFMEFSVLRSWAVLSTLGDPVGKQIRRHCATMPRTGRQKNME